MDQSAGQTVQSAVLFVIVGARNGQVTIFHGDGHVGVKLLGQGTLGALDGDNVVVLYLDLHSGGNGDRSSTNSRHSYNPPYQTNARTSPPT